MRLHRRRQPEPRRRQSALDEPGPAGERQSTGGRRPGRLGAGAFPTAERDRIRALVTAAHREGRRVRFWATPDVACPERDAVWSELLAAGVDHLNTDDLAGLELFLRAQDTGVRGGI